MTKPTKWHVHPGKTHISLGIHPVWSESSLCDQWVAKDPSFLHADSEDSDQTRQMPRLIWVFTGRTFILLVLSWGGWCCSCFLFQSVEGRQVDEVVQSKYQTKESGFWWWSTIWASSQGNLSSGFATKWGSNRTAQLQRQVRILKFWI